MGIVNVTPDSFSDGGRFLEPGRAIDHGRSLVEEGADILDVGGESTRPGASPVSLTEELDRVMPVVEALADRFPVPVSIDTSKPAVMEAAVACGAAMINDVNGLRAEGAMATAAASGALVCLMHMQGKPRTMQDDPRYKDVVSDICDFFRARLNECQAAGLGKERIVLDPGFGFGKTLDHNLELLRRLSELTDLGCPVLAGLSRKSMLGTLTGGRPAEQRVHASVAAALLAVAGGAAVVRVHDVAATVDALAVFNAVQDQNQ